MELDALAKAVAGQVDGDGTIRIDGVASLADAGPADLTFLANAKYAAAVATTRAAAVMVATDWAGEAPCALIRVANPDRAFAQAASLICPPLPELASGIHASAVVDPSAELGPDVRVGPCCVIEAGARLGAGTHVWAGTYIGHHAVIGDACKLYPNVTVRERVEIGDRVIIHSGAVVGSDGFGYVMDGGKWEKIPQVGIVVVGNDVEIGANVTIDRARFGKTVIGHDVKLDNLVQIAHNVTLGDHTALAAQVGIAGSTHIGQYVQIGGQAGVTGHVTVGDKVGIGGGAGVTKDIPSESFVSGFPAIPHMQSTRLQAHVAQLPKLKQLVKDLERRLQALEQTHVTTTDQDGKDPTP
ncbi:MAG: UDP-3-O-(3-hydroxymyristoyl)glucosamine N-acyltransferase [Verrucomicrobia bacterium]|nr:UDP-3-O-(3-hydroxymyristoyl)glucosamine N-acyltransferase [Verrucomicrobiota bacterium]